MGDDDNKLGPRGWFVMYLIATVILLLILLWLATGKGKRVTVDVHNGSHNLEIVEGFTDTQHSTG